MTFKISLEDRIAGFGFLFKAELDFSGIWKKFSSVRNHSPLYMVLPNGNDFVYVQRAFSDRIVAVMESPDGCLYFEEVGKTRKLTALDASDELLTSLYDAAMFISRKEIRNFQKSVNNVLDNNMSDSYYNFETQ